MLLFKDKVVVITGGTGSLGQALTQRLLEREGDVPAKIVIFSRDEAKQHFIRLTYQQQVNATDDIIYRDFMQRVEFVIGDIRQYNTVCRLLKKADIVINAAALKQVPSCEYFPFEAVQTNIVGAENIVQAIAEHRLPVQTVVGISTDKACKPINVMGMTKAIQERIFVNANLRAPFTRFICVRYGNVLSSRGSVIPLFMEQIANGGPVTLTDEEMTRFLLPLDQAVDTIFAALQIAHPGEIIVPRIPAARILDVARVLIGERPIKIRVIGIRPGEKVHENLISSEEAFHTYERGDYFVIKPLLPELVIHEPNETPVKGEYSSAHPVMSCEEIKDLLSRYGLFTPGSV